MRGRSHATPPPRLSPSRSDACPPALLPRRTTAPFPTPAPTRWPCRLPQLQQQPFSLALRQLEAAVTEQVLPSEALAANRAALAAVREFAASLEPQYGYPPAAVKNVQFVFR